MTYLNEFTILEMLNGGWDDDTINNIIEETIYRTKDMEIISAIGVVKALYGLENTEWSPKIQRLSEKCGKFPVYIDTEDAESVDNESQECFVSDCESCYESSDVSDSSSDVSETSYSSSEVSEASFMSIDTQENDDTNDSALPAWKTEEPKQLDDSLINMLETFSDLNQSVFCITGLLTNFNRAQAEYFIKYKNGVVVQNMSKRVDYLVVGDREAGKTKLDLAIRYQTKMITEQQLIALMGNVSSYSLYQSELKDTLNKIKNNLETELTAQENLKSVQTELLSTIDTAMDWTFDWNILDQN